MAGGRPSKYTPEMVENAKDYLATYRQLGRMIPSNAGLAVFLGVSRDTLYEWAKDEEKAEFSDILNKIQAKQEEVLIDKGLDGEFNAAITKLALGKHGYHDKVDSTLGGPDGKPVPVQYVVQPVRAKDEPKGEEGGD
jgi:hypothetical protein